MTLKRLRCLAVLVTLALPALDRAATQKKQSGKAAPQPATHASAASKSKSGKTKAAHKSSVKHVAPAQAHRYTQQAPTPERYQEIQKALADKGFYRGEVNGQWGPDSIDALRQFQQAQKLEPDGKIGSRSLIALGLGPKRSLTANAEADAPQVQPQ